MENKSYQFIRPLRPPRNKKGEGFFSWFFIIIVLVGVSFSLLIINMVWGEIQPELTQGMGNSVNDSDVNITKILGQTGGATRMFDSLLPFLLIGLMGFVLISAGAILKHPVMLFVGIIVLGVVILIAVVYSNVYQEIAGTEAFEDTAKDLKIQTLLMENLPKIIFILSLGTIVFLLWRGTSGRSNL